MSTNHKICAKAQAVKDLEAAADEAVEFYFDYSTKGPEALVTEAFVEAIRADLDLLQVYEWIRGEGICPQELRVRVWQASRDREFWQ